MLSFSHTKEDCSLLKYINKWKWDFPAHFTKPDFSFLK